MENSIYQRSVQRRSWDGNRPRLSRVKASLDFVLGARTGGNDSFADLRQTKQDGMGKLKERGEGKNKLRGEPHNRAYNVNWVSDCSFQKVQGRCSPLRMWKTMCLAMFEITNAMLVIQVSQHT